MVDKEAKRVYSLYRLTYKPNMEARMLTLDELIEETGINRYTLAKYRDLGLIPKPEIIHQGNKKEGQPRGNQALYPDYTPWIIEEIKRLKARPYRYTLSHIREEIGDIEDITPKEQVSEPMKPDIMDTIVRINRLLDQETDDYERIRVEFDRDNEDGKLKVTRVFGRRKKKKGTNG